MKQTSRFLLGLLAVTPLHAATISNAVHDSTTDSGYYRYDSYFSSRYDSYRDNEVAGILAGTSSYSRWGTTDISSYTAYLGFGSLDFGSLDTGWHYLELAVRSCSSVISTSFSPYYQTTSAQLEIHLIHNPFGDIAASSLSEGLSYDTAPFHWTTQTADGGYTSEEGFTTTLLSTYGYDPTQTASGDRMLIDLGDLNDLGMAADGFSLMIRASGPVISFESPDHGSENTSAILYSATAIPEPSSFLLMSCSLMVLLSRRRRS